MERDIEGIIFHEARDCKFSQKDDIMQVTCKVAHYNPHPPKMVSAVVVQKSGKEVARVNVPMHAIKNSPALRQAKQIPILLEEMPLLDTPLLSELSR